jgi:hypothetical protein
VVSEPVLDAELEEPEVADSARPAGMDTDSERFDDLDLENSEHSLVLEARQARHLCVTCPLRAKMATGKTNTGGGAYPCCARDKTKTITKIIKRTIKRRTTRTKTVCLTTTTRSVQKIPLSSLARTSTSEYCIGFRILVLLKAILTSISLYSYLRDKIYAWSRYKHADCHEIRHRLGHDLPHGYRIYNPNSYFDRNSL